MSKKNKLTIYLFKEGITKLEDVFNDISRIKRIPELPNDEVYYCEQTIKTPSWVKSFFNIECDFLRQTGSQVILLKRIQFDDCERVFALTFGYSKHLLKCESLEDMFGIKVVLNSIGDKDIRKISKTCIGTNHKRTEEQLPRSSDINEFGFDVARDLIKGVTGKTDDVTFEKGTISGYDSLSISIEKTIDNIDDFLRECLIKYKATTYQARFGWLDNIKAIKHNRELIEELQVNLFNEIMNRNFESVWMAVPDVLNWEEVAGFKISNDKKLYDDIQIEIVIDSFKKELTSLDDFKNKVIYALSSKNDGVPLKTWSAYNCLIGEIFLNGHQYCISEGKWYEINNDFVKTINNEYTNIGLLDVDFIPFANNDNEDTYNSKLASSLNGSIVMHKAKIPIGGGSGNTIEPCDLYLKNTFIHVKRNRGSNNLSHLFNQGLVSAKSLIDKSVYKKFQDKAAVCKAEQLVNCEIPKTMESNKTTIVFAIINRFVDERPKIPFFSKVSLCYVVKEISYFGYDVKIKNIITK